MVSAGPPSSLSGWADVKSAWSTGDGWGSFGVTGIKGLDREYWSGFCQLLRPIIPVLFDLFNLTHLECLNRYQSGCFC